jgi:hypothetical protein
VVGHAQGGVRRTTRRLLGGLSQRMDVIVAVISILVMAGGLIALLSVGGYWFVLRMDDINHHANLILTLWALVAIALGGVGLLWADSLSDSVQVLGVTFHL